MLDWFGDMAVRGLLRVASEAKASSYPNTIRRYVACLPKDHKTRTTLKRALWQSKGLRDNGALMDALLHHFGEEDPDFLELLGPKLLTEFPLRWRELILQWEGRALHGEQEPDGSTAAYQRCLALKKGLTDQALDKLKELDLKTVVDAAKEKNRIDSRSSQLAYRNSWLQWCDEHLPSRGLLLLCGILLAFTSSLLSGVLPTILILCSVAVPAYVITVCAWIGCVLTLAAVACVFFYNKHQIFKDYIKVINERLARCVDEKQTIDSRLSTQAADRQAAIQRTLDRSKLLLVDDESNLTLQTAARVVRGALSSAEVTGVFDRVAHGVLSQLGDYKSFDSLQAFKSLIVAVYVAGERYIPEAWVPVLLAQIETELSERLKQQFTDAKKEVEPDLDTFKAAFEQETGLDGSDETLQLVVRADIHALKSEIAGDTLLLLNEFADREEEYCLSQLLSQWLAVDWVLQSLIHQRRSSSLFCCLCRDLHRRMTKLVVSQISKALTRDEVCFDRELFPTKESIERQYRFTSNFLNRCTTFFETTDLGAEAKSKVFRLVKKLGEDLSQKKAEVVQKFACNPQDIDHQKYATEHWQLAKAWQAAAEAGASASQRPNDCSELVWAQAKELSEANTQAKVQAHALQAFEHYQAIWQTQFRDVTSMTKDRFIALKDMATALSRTKDPRRQIYALAATDAFCCFRRPEIVFDTRPEEDILRLGNLGSKDEIAEYQRELIGLLPTDCCFTRYSDRDVLLDKRAETRIAIVRQWCLRLPHPSIPLAEKSTYFPSSELIRSINPTRLSATKQAERDKLLRMIAIGLNPPSGQESTSFLTVLSKEGYISFHNSSGRGDYYVEPSSLIDKLLAQHIEPHQIVFFLELIAQALVEQQALEEADKIWCAIHRRTKQGAVLHQRATALDQAQFPLARGKGPNVMRLEYLSQIAAFNAAVFYVTNKLMRYEMASGDIGKYLQHAAEKVAAIRQQMTSCSHCPLIEGDLLFLEDCLEAVGGSQIYANVLAAQRGEPAVGVDSTIALAAHNVM